MEIVMPESVLGIVVPEAEPLVKALRDRFDSSAALGVPAHITILYPFIPPSEITPDVLAELQQFFAQFPAFEFALTELRRFPQTLYLAPEPAERFKDLIQAIVERYPDYPPYGGAFAEVLPHLTIADVNAGAQLDIIEREFMQQHGMQLPVMAKASEVLLIENSSGRWEVRETFELATLDAFK
jgi:2'-5' RNA ligase